MLPGAKMRFDVLTLFPELFSGYVSQSILNLAIERGLVQVHLWNIRNWATGKHKASTISRSAAGRVW
jgi:tRNA (guanine37-N1)-methyltransferase